MHGTKSVWLQHEGIIDATAQLPLRLYRDGTGGFMPDDPRHPDARHRAMDLGVAFQLGLIPVSAWSIAWAIKDSIRRDHRKNLKAFNIGRKLALEPRGQPEEIHPPDPAADPGRA
jgi:hypothetical protein